MARTISDEDIEVIASRLVKLIGQRLLAEESRQAMPMPAPQPAAPEPLKRKLAYSIKELSEELSISKETLYRLEIRGLIKSLPYFRHKVFSLEEVERFLAGQGGDARPLERIVSRKKRNLKK